MEVSHDTSVTTFTIFDRDVQQILNTTTSELLDTQNANKTDIPQSCIPFGNTLLNLKSSSQLEGRISNLYHQKDFYPKKYHLA